MKIKQALSYLKMVPSPPAKKRKFFKGRNYFENNRSFIRTLMDNGFIPYQEAPPDLLVDIVDDEHTIFEPNLLEE